MNFLHPCFPASLTISHAGWGCWESDNIQVYRLTSLILAVPDKVILILGWEARNCDQKYGNFFVMFHHVSLSIHYTEMYPHEPI